MTPLLPVKDSTFLITLLIILDYQRFIFQNLFLGDELLMILIISTLTYLFNNIHTFYLNTHQKKRSEWFFSPLVDTINTLLSNSIFFQRIFPKLSQSLIFTKKRVFNFYLKENLRISPHTLQNRRKAYNNIFLSSLP